MRQIFLGLFALVAVSFAQEFRATISGRVSDSQGAVIPGVKVLATQIATAAKFETVSAADGLYTIPFLPPGIYRLVAENAGFKRYVRDSVSAGANERLGLDIQMEIGAVTENRHGSRIEPELNRVDIARCLIVVGDHVKI